MSCNKVENLQNSMILIIDKVKEVPATEISIGWLGSCTRCCTFIDVETTGLLMILPSGEGRCEFVDGSVLMGKCDLDLWLQKYRVACS